MTVFRNLFSKCSINECEDFVNDYICKLNYREMLYMSELPLLESSDLKFIEHIIFNFNYYKKLKPLSLKLYKYTKCENLLFACLNLYDVKVIKKRLFYKNNSDYILVDGLYNGDKNLLVYNTISDLPHEFLHLCSTPPSCNNCTRNSGFYYVYNGKGYNRGMNEGYTELLTKRIFFDGDYRSDCYTKNMYLMMIFELLYDDYKTMEDDYFRANSKGPSLQFKKYASDMEFCKLNTYLNKMDYIVTKEESLDVFNLMNSIVERTSDNDKIVKAKNYTKEFFALKK